MAIATNYGIWFMLGVVVVMLAAFATFFIHLMRRAKMLAEASGASDAARETRPASDAGTYVRGQEGTA
jgi:hypothetical protein